MGYGPGAYPPPYGPVPPVTAPGGRRRKRLLVLAASVLVAIVAVVAVALLSRSSSNSLSHAKVEAQIEAQTQVKADQFTALTHVSCNNGKDMAVKAGATYPCTADGSVKLTVKVVDGGSDPTWTWARTR